MERLTAGDVAFEVVTGLAESFHVTARRGTTVLWNTRVAAQIMPYEIELTLEGGRLRLRVDGDHPRGGVITCEFLFDAATGQVVG